MTRKRKISKRTHFAEKRRKPSHGLNLQPPRRAHSAPFLFLTTNGPPVWDIEPSSSSGSSSSPFEHGVEPLDGRGADPAYVLLLARVDDTLSYHLNAKTLFEPGDLYAGYDVGRKHDLSVLVVLERVKKEFYWRGAVELREAPFDEQSELLTSILKVPGLRRLAIDQSGLGMQLAEELKRRHSSRVEPITMTAPVKESLASRILAAFQRGDVTIPDHRPLIDDLHSIQRTVTLSGNVRYAAPREAGSHADRWTALALALHAAGPAPVEFIMPWSPRRIGRREQLRRWW